MTMVNEQFPMKIAKHAMQIINLDVSMRIFQ